MTKEYVFNVGGESYSFTEDQLKRYPESLLSHMVTDGTIKVEDSLGKKEVPVTRNRELFGFIAALYKSGSIAEAARHLPRTFTLPQLASLRAELDFYQLPTSSILDSKALQTAVSVNARLALVPQLMRLSFVVAVEQHAQQISSDVLQRLADAQAEQLGSNPCKVTSTYLIIFCNEDETLVPYLKAWHPSMYAPVAASTTGIVLPRSLILNDFCGPTDYDRLLSMEGVVGPEAPATSVSPDILIEILQQLTSRGCDGVKWHEVSIIIEEQGKVPMGRAYVLAVTW
mmetsp:Transcript_13683/g.29366  ORF Transcript_13683/g.29366 Transcript_13683/m.29366 type:complete len:285 (+) Transcript_13683:180-1034(+)|eukprot:CAMPEP_0202912500 /NCGR_PEP_ID=MMETSP1392-20130828/57912_1 /ASSEMBLY_ACC=CAM_ASM_000868 /TAXON_ID=225041 /ORGANISM="Chlamydomonas chlamydogama, Strain SAG 11-48b" /LENGTH=284 /DNA_ID=CAMNT_0049603427 /DNA_START=82 /DNA_END=936 /DNA_ORIENTATION=-